MVGALAQEHAVENRVWRRSAPGFEPGENPNERAGVKLNYVPRDSQPTR